MLHEDRSSLSAKTLDMKRAIDSLREEFEAVDWYRQRAEACDDKNLRKILEHNMREEEEHAAMLLAWIAQRDPVMQMNLKKYLGREPSEIAKD